MDEQIRKYYEGELTIDERLELLSRMQSDKALKKEMIRYQQLFALISLTPQTDDLQQAAGRYSRFMHGEKWKNWWRYVANAARYAAVILCLVVGTWIAAGIYFAPKPAAQAMNTLYVPAGQRISLTLPDGTSVWLNAQTTLTYPTAFSEKERRVKIEGEAFFEVAKDPQKPFIVTSGKVNVKVTGTTFNICSYPDEGIQKVSLIEGSVFVSVSGNESSGFILKPDEEAKICDNRISVARIPNSDYFLWKDGIFSFENESLETMLKKLKMYYDIDIVVTDPSIFQWRYTVKFRQRDGIREIIRLLQRTHRFTVEINEESNRITIRK